MGTTLVAMKIENVPSPFHVIDEREIGSIADQNMDELYKLLPTYNCVKHGDVVQRLLNGAFIDLVDQIWSDPMDVYLFQQLAELKSIAKTLNKEVYAI